MLKYVMGEFGGISSSVIHVPSYHVPESAPCVNVMYSFVCNIQVVGAVAAFVGVGFCL